MGMREKLIEILRVPIYPHELADPAEVVADYLLDNDVVPVVRCKDCENRDDITGECKHPKAVGWDVLMPEDDDFCSYGERRTDERKTD